MLTNFISLTFSLFTTVASSIPGTDSSTLMPTASADITAPVAIVDNGYDTTVVDVPSHVEDINVLSKTAEVGFEFDTPVANSPEKQEPSLDNNDFRENSFSLAAIAILDDNEISSCNGITINAQWVLSAAHCFLGDRPLSSYFVFTDVQSSVEEIVFLEGADLALAKLAGAYPNVGCTPLPQTTAKTGDNADIFVFRDNARIERIPLIIDDSNYLADNPAVGLGAHEMLSLVSPEGGELTRSGDSGAGIFITNVDGMPQVQGIVSGVAVMKHAVLAEDLAQHSDHIYSIAGSCVPAYSPS
ncbi:trypsin-like serine protease [Corynebacterium kozikiae]|uniref:trypsin-like serine protease n=1 Tax=Corynebacterium kozikiae TaxID=2968469 RepID=UPI00211D026A|nr:trypsin-like serine protease [Corynebacterium sp. 76QC2CO]MCQ9344102.1 trypsin-like serine protease [Corynebacterium sp. 76QC2CO]